MKLKILSVLRKASQLKILHRRRRRRRRHHITNYLHFVDDVRQSFKVVVVVFGIDLNELHAFQYVSVMLDKQKKKIKKIANDENIKY